MNEIFVELAIAGVSIGGTFLVMWGMARGKISDLERRTEQLEEEYTKQLDLIHSLRDVYVSYQHFNEIMATIKESQRELKEDLKKVLDLLTVRLS